MFRALRIILPHLVILCLLWGGSAHAQGNKLSIQATTPKNMSVCGFDDTCLISVYNISSSVITNVKVTLLLPAGVNYIKGSLTGSGVAESNVSNTNRPVFTGPSLLIAQNFKFRVKLVADCDIVPLLSGSNSPQIDIRVDYSGNYDLGSSNPFVPIIPAPGYASITNVSFIGNVGDKFVRKVTITNYGKGPLKALRFMRINGKDLAVKAQTGFNNKTSGDTIYTYFANSDFAKVGDKDTLLEQNESIIISDTFVINGCNYVNTYYEIGWGCNNKICQVTKNNAAVTISGDNPNVKTWPSSIDKLCYDGTTRNAQFLTLTNIGKKDAKEVTVFIYVGTGAANTYIDTGSVYLKTGYKGVLKRKNIDSSSQIYYTTTCVGSADVTYIRLKLGNLAPGDTFYLSWDMFRCAPTDCNSSFYDLNWIYYLNYKNQCNNLTSVGAAWGKVYRYSGGSVSLWVPTDLARDEVKDFKFNFNSFYDLPMSSTGKIIIDLVLPSTLDHSLSKNDFYIMNGALSATWYPDSVVRKGDTLRGFFGNSFKFNLTSAEMTVKLKGICTKYGGNTALPVTMSLYYNPQPKCNPSIWIRPICVSFLTKVHCSKNCNGGLWFKNFEAKRISFGKPDNNNDGLADATGGLDMTKVRPERLMFGDTFLTTFTGRPKNTSSINNWKYGYAESFVAYGSYVDVVEARLIVYKGITLQSGNCNTVRVKKIVSGANATFKFDFSIDSIYPKGCLSSSYRFTQNDSIILEVKYRVSGNLSGAAAQMNFSNRFYFGSVANPGPGQYFQCDTFGANLLLYGYYYANCCSDNVVYSNCAEVGLSQSWYLGMGPCCVNYAGNNLFPYEYRNFTKLKALRIYLPSGLKLINTYFGQYRTAGVGNYVLESTTGVPVKKGSSSPLVFEFAKYYKDSGGNINYGDDGVQGYFTYTVQPRCNLPTNTPIRIDYDYIFERQGTFGTGYDTIKTGSYDLFTFNPPVLKLQPAVPTVYANSDTVDWEVRYSNPSSAFNAYNIWLSPKASSNIKVVEIRDLDKDTLVKPTKDIYRAGILLAGKVRRFKIRAIYNDCNPDSLILFGSYNCAEYPVDFASYPCTPNRTALLLEPQNTRLQLTLTDSTSILDLCATNKLSLLVENIQAVTAYNTKIRVSLPIGMQVVAGSAQLKYPLNSSLVSIGQPKLISGTIYEWDLPKLSSAVAAGFKGTSDTAKNKMLITFRVITNCDYASGSFVSARALANIKCGNPVPAVPAFSDPLDIKGVTRPYYTLLKSWADTLLPCQKPMGIKTRVIFLGPGKSGTKDLVEIFLPDGVTLDTSYWNAIRNAPSKDSLKISNINGASLLSWRVPANILPGDSLEFDVRVNGNGDLLNCGPLDIISRSVVVQPVVCISTGNACDIKVITGSELATPVVDKGDIQLESPTIQTKIIGADSEFVKLTFVVRNKGRFMTASDPLVVRYHYDKNNSGKWDVSDPFLGTDTFYKTLANNAFFAVSKSLKVKAGQSCGIIAVIDSAACSCIFGQRLFGVPPFQNAGPDTAICSGQPLAMGIQKVNNFSYVWNNDQLVNNVNIANPDFIATNQTGVAENHELILTTNRGNCITKDTVSVIIYPVPVIKTLVRDTQICEKQKVLLRSQTIGGNGGYTYLWAPITGLTDPKISNTLAAPATNTKYFVLVTDKKGCKSSDSSKITVRPYPVANFTWPVSCQGSDVLVTDSSFISSGNIVLRIWKTPLYDTFGVTSLPLSFGGASSMQVTLILESDAGCADTAVKLVDLKPIPVPLFSVAWVCANDSSYFVNNSAIASGKINSWIWQFGDGKSTIQKSPVHRYAVASDYTVKLIATSDFGCRDSVEGPARVFPLPKALFTASSTCERDSLRFKNNSLVFGDTLKGYLWNLGVLGNGTETDPTRWVNNYGDYPVKLNVQTIHGCEDSMSSLVPVHPLPRAGFSAGDKCLGIPSDFKDTSKINKGIISKRIWNFGDGNSTVVLNPSHIYKNNGIFSVKLLVESDKGCKDSVVGNTEIFPLAHPSFSVMDHCNRETININSSDWGGGQAKSWKWYTGNGDSLQTRNMSYKYSIPGIYLLRLQITSDHGCIADTQVRVENYPLPVVSAVAINPCNDDSAVIQGKVALSKGVVSKYQWTFSDGSQANTKNVNRTFNTSGNYSATLVVTSDKNCMDSAATAFVIQPPVKIAFDVADVCIDENSVFVNNCTSVEPITRFTWNFGDGKTSSMQAPVYAYSAPGTFKVTLTAETKPGCLYSLVKNTVVHNRPYPGLAVDPSVGTIVNPNITVLDLSSGADTIWYYTSDGYRNGQRNFVRAFPDSGTFRIWQVAKTNYNCLDSAYKDIYINFMYTLFVPQAFTPNSDSKNETFGPGGLGIQWYSMKIYSRWGELVYETNNSVPWDGKINGIAAMDGVYAVLINIRDYKGKRHYYRGSVTVLH